MRSPAFMVMTLLGGAALGAGALGRDPGPPPGRGAPPARVPTAPQAAIEAGHST